MLTLYDQERSPDSPSNNLDETPEETLTDDVRDIHALNPTAPENNSRSMTTLPPPPALRGYFSPPRSTTNMSEGASSGENFTTISREFNALVIAGSTMENNEHRPSREDERQHDLMRIHEERDQDEETNPLAIVPDQYPNSGLDPGPGQGHSRVGMTVQRVKRKEVEAKITAWQTEKLAKINNRFKKEDAVINGWVNEQVHKANSWMKKIEMISSPIAGVHVYPEIKSHCKHYRKLEDRKAKAMEKTQNKLAKAQRKAGERRASAEAKRGTKVAKVIEVSNLLRAVGRPPPKRSFCSFSS